MRVNHLRKKVKRRSLTDLVNQILNVCLFVFLVAFSIVSLVSCGAKEIKAPVEAAKVPVFVFTQAAPDGKTVAAVVPSGLVAREGNLDKVVQSIAPNTKLDVLQFGKTLGQFQPSAIKSSDALGALAIFKLAEDSTKSNAPPINQTVWQQPNLIILPSEAIAKSKPESDKDNRTDQFTCPVKIQPLILDKSRDLFQKLGANPSLLSQLTLASLICVDLNRDSQPEIIAGLRLDNPIRPNGIDPQAWQAFLSRPASERQEYSMLVFLHRTAGSNQPTNSTQGDWTIEPIINHTRALSYLNDSVSSYALVGAQDLNTDRYAELIVQEIGLNTFDVLVISPSVREERWQWQNYYENERSLNIVQ
ncbi:hypothetical protein V2H45_04425 [Tumidithrix elongata RA019]|uniref:Uncharacterized protein n=1 Tax=Tumidithrix elongata BACA0141 TaxID=2716417 RepID=A0AAW9PXJ8_9CYAN|nr:hypothetical protein [Tumidithrix elongata RA019]